MPVQDIKKHDKSERMRIAIYDAQLIGFISDAAESRGESIQTTVFKMLKEYKSIKDKRVKR